MKIPHVVNLPTQQVHPPMSEIIVSEEGVFKLLSEQDENKAPGPDGVPAKILKLFAAQLAPALTHIFNKSLTTGILPEDWLSANISPIFKKGIEPLLPTIDRCLWHIFVVNSLNTYCIVTSWGTSLNTRFSQIDSTDFAQTILASPNWFSLSTTLLSP